jgi:2-iminobutanoate/2-iminopropanoate deaminase
MALALHHRSILFEGAAMKRETVRVEPISSWLAKRNAPVSAVARGGGLVFVSGLPPFDPDTGELFAGAIERQTELVLEQLKLCLETAGTSLQNVLKCNVYCTSAGHFAAVNAVLPATFRKIRRREFSSAPPNGSRRLISRLIVWP